MAGEILFCELSGLMNEIDLDCLDKSHTDACWDDDFTNIASFMQTFDEEMLPISNNFDSILEKMHNILSVVAKESKRDGFWSTFQDASVNPSRLSTFLCYLIAKGFSTLPKMNLRILKVVSCYLLLISTPERNVYRILSFTTFDRSMRILQRVVAMLLSNGAVRVEKGKRKKSRNCEDVAGRKKRRRRNNNKINNNNNNDVDDIDAPASQYSNNNNNNGGSVDDDGGDDIDPEDLKSELVSVLKDLLVLSSSESLDDPVVERMTEVVVEMVSVETIANMCNVDVYLHHNFSNICHLSHKILYQLVQSDQSRSTGKPHLFSKICHKLLPNVTLCKQGGQSIPQAAVVVRDNTVTFMRFVAESFGEDVEKVVKNFIQHACVSAVDKADHRIKTAQALTNLLQGVSSKIFSEVATWLLEKLAKSSKVPHRMFSVDMISMLLEGEQNVTVLADDELTRLHQDLVRTLIDRCSDTSSSVRAKAIGSLSKFTSLLVESVSMETSARRHGNASSSSSSMVHFNGTMCRSMNRNASRLESTSMMHFCSQMSIGAFNLTANNCTINLPDNSGLISMLRRRCCDKKVAVRRASVISLSNFIILEGQALNKENLESVSERCNDTSIAVRKQALQSLTDILVHVPTEQVQREWLRRLLYSSADEDNNIQTKALELLERVAIDGLAGGHDNDTGKRCGSGGDDDDDIGIRGGGCGGDHDDDANGLAWDLMGILTEQDNYDQRRFFSKACKVWRKKNLLQEVVVCRVLERIGGKRSEVAWFLLSEFTTIPSDSLLRRIKTSWDEAVKDFEQQRVSMATGQQAVRDLEGSICGSMMKIVTNTNNNNIGGGNEELLLLVVDYIFKSLCNFGHRVNDVSFLVDVLTKTSRISDELHGIISSGFDGLFDICKEHIGTALQVDRIGVGNDDDDKLLRCLFTYGEVAQVSEGRIDKSSFHLLVQFIADDNQLPSSSSSSSSSVPISQFRGKKCSRDVRAFVFLSLGKFCLSSCEFAKLCLPALTRELKTYNDPRLRNNVIFVLCDLVVKYAAIVDPYIGCISAHLGDKCPLVRKQTCLLLTRLLQEDYVKWKGSLFFRFVRGVVDDNASVRETVIFTLKHIHNRRSEGLFFQNFVEGIFYFNKLENMSSFSCSQREQDKGQEDDAFYLVGDENQEKRMEIYKFLLESMTDSQRFQVMGRLVNEVMTSFVEEAVELNRDSSRVLKDVLLCLSCQEIKLSVLKQQQRDDENDDNMADSSAAAVENAAKKQFITQVMRRTVIEAIFPIAVSLKALLEKHKSPVLRELMSYVAVLTKDYKQEVKAILEMDPSLEKEIEFDLRRSEVTKDTSQTPQKAPSNNDHPPKANMLLNFPNARRTSLATMTLIEAARNVHNQRLILNKSVD